MGMYFKSLRIHVHCELLGPCEGDGACLGKGSELDSRGWVLNPQRLIYVVNWWGLVKRRVRAELTGIDLNPKEFCYAVNMSDHSLPLVPN